ncbi:MAG TPA: serine hydrolase [Candidatus Limnocylindrales bacterium]|nr:serine hydrolase [Candidatus Limnocylindrales bacterium]
MKDSQLQKKKKRLFKKSKETPKKLKEKAVSAPKVSSSKYSFFKKVNERESILLFFLIPFILIIIYFTLFYLNNHLSKSIQLNKLTNSQSLKMQPFPVVDMAYVPYLSAKAAVVLDVDSGSIVFSKNPNLRFSMASTTKIMTALVALEAYELRSVLTVKSRGIPGSTMGLSVGEKLIFEDLLFAMLLPSANDAAVAIVDNYPGGKTAFIKKMNDKAKSLHLDNTLFSDPTGLDDDGNFTTVNDLAVLGAFAMENKKISEVVGTTQKSIANQNNSKQYSLVNLNRLLGTNGVNGIKTGTTEGAGEVLVTSAIQKGHKFIIVVMNSQDRFSDTRALLSFVSQNVRHEEIKYTER